MTALVLQARLGSTRLPRKAMLPLGGRPMIFRVMEAFISSPWNAKILACPEDDAAVFAPLAGEAGFSLVPGPAEDVLARYCLAIRRSGADRVIRATGDNPFVFTDAAAAIDRESVALGAHYGGYFSLPYGAGVQSVDSDALLRAEREASSQADRENVCTYLYDHPLLFSIHRPVAPREWQGLEMRVTVDTPEDYERAKILYGYLSSLPPPERNLGKNVIGAYLRFMAHNGAEIHSGGTE